MNVPPTRNFSRWFDDERVQLALLCVFALLLLGLGIGLRDPWPSDEPRFALVAREMLASGQWLFPHRGVELYSDKPPMFMWLQACAYFLTGGWRGWFLLPSLLAGLGTIVLVYDFTRRQWNHRTGLIAATAVLVSFDFTFQMRAAQIDGVEVFWITLAMYGLLRHLLLGPAWRWYAIGFLAAGMGVITKGVGVVALLVFLPFWFARWRGWNHVLPAQHRDARWWLALLIFVPILGWALPMLWSALHVHAGDAAYARYAHDILLGQTVDRYAAPKHHFHPWWFYLPTIAFEWLPLSLALPWAIPGWKRALQGRDARTLLPLAWAVLVVIFFSLSGGKRDVYILPALPITAIALAPLLPAIVQRASFRWALWALTLLLALVLLLAGLGMHLGHLQKWAALASSALDGSPTPLIAMILGIGIAGVAIALIARPRHAAWGWCTFALATWGAWGLVAYPLLNGYSSARTVMARTANVVPAGDPIALVAWKEQNLLMLDMLGRDTVNFGFKLAWHEQLQRALDWQAADPAHRWVFAYGDVLAPCVREADAVHVGHANRREWYVFNRSAVVPGCVPPRSDDAGQFGAHEPDDD
ncbi:MAG: dolichyl-phosphate-mannose-protein mannosyltransferase family protein [Rhodanobacteraceae bacterium]|nr:MAG: dolichyl-phosphate-mannose-protein mannosyltransferase family protein [Rhodanobacteraceae bacterium]